MHFSPRKSRRASVGEGKSIAHNNGEKWGGGGERERERERER